MPRFPTPLAFLNFEIPFAVYIAIGLILIAAVVLIVSRLGILPDKGVRYLAAALLAVFGIAVFREWRSRRLGEKADKLEGQIGEQEKLIKQKLATANAAEEKAKATEEKAKAAEEKAKATEEEAKVTEEDAKAAEQEAKTAETNARAAVSAAKAAEEDLRRFQAAAQEEHLALQKQALLVKEKRKERRAEIDKFSPDETRKAFKDVFSP